jgi:hypothetical protein
MEQPVVWRLIKADAPVLAIAVPAGTLAIVSLALVVSAAMHRGPLWSDRTLNVSEAAATRDRATMMWLIEQGSDPAKSYPVAAGILFDRPLHLTPLEAAIAARRSEIVDLLLWKMGRRDAAVLTRAWCLARQTGEDDLTRAVERYRTDAREPEPDCSQMTAPW